MTLKELLSLRKLSDLLDIYKYYFNNDNNLNKKKDLIEAINNKILKEETIYEIFFILNKKEINILKRGITIKITKNNVANILNINSFGCGYIDGDSFIIPSDISYIVNNISNNISKEKYELYHYILGIKIYACNMWSIFNESDVFKLFILNEKFKNTYIDDFISAYRKITSEYNVSNLVFYPKVKGTDTKTDNKIRYPKYKELIEYVDCKFISNKYLDELKKIALNKLNLIETEMFLREIYNFCISNNDVLKGTKIVNNYFNYRLDDNINKLANLVVRLYYNTPKSY